MKHRLELFSDAVLAIIMTIMVLDLHTPATGGWQAFLPILPAIGAYAVGFITLVGFWVVHASFFARVEEITRAMMWLNFAFLFLASLVPFLIRDLAEHPGDRADTIVFLTLAYLTISMLTLFRVAAHKQHYRSPDFTEWYRKRNRTTGLGGIMIVVLLLTAWFWPFASLGLFVAISVWNLTTV
jgi:uncharacterized membrane protein